MDCVPSLHTLRVSRVSVFPAVHGNGYTRNTVPHPVVFSPSAVVPVPGRLEGMPGHGIRTVHTQV